MLISQNIKLKNIKACSKPSWKIVLLSMDNSIISYNKNAYTPSIKYDKNTYFPLEVRHLLNKKN